MKKIKTCSNSTTLLLLLFIGIVMVLAGYRIFSYLCEAAAFIWWMLPLGVLMAALAVVGFMLAYRSWRRLQELRDHPYEEDAS